MEDLIVDVKLWGRMVGSLAWDAQAGAAVFEYDRNFRQSGLEIAPLTMPLSLGMRPFTFPGNRNDCFKGLPGLIADSLPDRYGDQIITEWFRNQGLSADEITPLERLSYMGKRGMGALEFEPSRAASILNESTEIYVNELTQLAEEVFTQREAFQTRMADNDKIALDILRVGTSAGGAKPKAIIAYNEETNDVRSGQVKAPEGFGYWILKFDGTSYSEHGSVMEKQAKGTCNVEYSYHKMAKDCDIEMMECRLLSDGDSQHFMTRRYDRTIDGEKIHTQTAAGLGHLNRDQRHSYEEIFAIIRKLGLSMEASVEFYRRMVFNVVARNNDDHTKNFSFLMDKNGKWSMAPAYDLCYTYKKGGKWVEQHQLALNGKRDNFTRQDLLDVANNMGIRQASSIIDQVVEVVSHWREYAIDNGVKESYIKEIEDNLYVSQIGKISHTERNSIDNIQKKSVSAEDKAFLFDVAVRLTKARYPQDKLDEHEKARVQTIFSSLGDHEKEYVLSDLWKNVENDPKANKNGRWISDAKEYLNELINRIDSHERGKGRSL